MAKKGLGRGLGALMSENLTELPEQETPRDGSLCKIHISDIEPNRKQPRKRFDEAALMELADSISAHGLLEPIVVRKKENGYFEIIAGERRWRASRIAGLSEIPAVLRELDDKEAALLSLIENLQREDLNPVEEALGYQDLIERFDLTQEDAAKRVGKSRASVANLLRILKHPKSVLELVENGRLSYGHARTLLPLADQYEENDLLAAANRVIDEELSVRQTEALVKKMLCDDATPKAVSKDPVREEHFRRLERRISDAAGRKASIKREKDGSGKLVLAFGSSEDLEELIKTVCGRSFFEETDDN